MQHGGSKDDLDVDIFLIDVTEPGRDRVKTLSFTRSPLILLNFAANRFTRNSARLYQETFGINFMDWRMLVMLTKEPDIPVTRASRTIGIDKAAVSRSLVSLEQQGLATHATHGSNARRKLWRLTPRGRALHAQILKGALKRQKELLRGLKREDVLRLNSYFQIIIENLEAESLRWPASGARGSD